MRVFLVCALLVSVGLLGSCGPEVDSDIGPNPWVQKSSLPYKSISHACCAVDGKIYLTGGIPSRWGFLIYDPDADEWTEGPPLPTGRQHHTCASVDGKLYVFGGPYEGGSGMEVDVLDVYDPVDNSWITLGDLPEARSSAAAAVIGSQIYHLGGIVDGQKGAAVDVYDVDADTWNAAPDMPRAIHSAAAAALPDRILSVGGRTDDQYFIEDNEPVLDPRNAWTIDPGHGTWQDIAALSVFRQNLVAVAHDGRVYVFGGSYSGDGGDKDILSTAERWDPNIGVWEPLTPMPVRRSNACGTLVGDTIYIAGGGYVEDHQYKKCNEVFAYQPALDRGPGVETPPYESERPPAILWVEASDGTHADHVELNWHNGGAGFGYTVWRSEHEDGPFCKLWDTEDLMTHYEDTEVESGATYWYRISYWDEGMPGESELSQGDSGFAAVK